MFENRIPFEVGRYSQLSDGVLRLAILRCLDQPPGLVH